MPTLMPFPDRTEPSIDPGAHRSLRWGPRAAGLLAVVALVATGCGGSTTGNGQATNPTVVVTTSIWADVVANVACDGQVLIETVIPAGADPHAFEPSLADRASMEAAALVVANGLGLEEGLEDTLGAVADSGITIFRAGDHIDTIPYHGAAADEGDHGEDDGERGDDHAGEGDDPHVWFDLRRVSTALPALADALVAEVGLDPTAVAECVDAYAETLEAADADIEALVAELPGASRTLVTNHDSLGYFADRYGFEILGTVLPAPSGLAETNPAQLEALAQLIEDAAVPAIFAESQHTTDDADALATRLGDVAVVVLDTGTLGEAGSGADTYVGLVRSNAELIVAALR